MHHEASLCWVCGGHTDQAVSYWARNCAGTSGLTVEVLQVRSPVTLRRPCRVWRVGWQRRRV
jgi:hypothetical protein